MPAAQRPQTGDELVTVAVGEQQFAIDIMSVREIRGWHASTPLPNAPPYFLGMINLRGVILPVIDLSTRLGLGAAQLSASSVVIVVQIEERQVGLLVDAVCDILRVTEGMIQDPPDIGMAPGGHLVQGVMTTDDGIIGLLALDRIVPPELEAAA